MKMRNSLKGACLLAGGVFFLYVGTVGAQDEKTCDLGWNTSAHDDYLNMITPSCKKVKTLCDLILQAVTVKDETTGKSRSGIDKLGIDKLGIDESGKYFLTHDQIPENNCMFKTLMKKFNDNRTQTRVIFSRNIKGTLKALSRPSFNECCVMKGALRAAKKVEKTVRGPTEVNGFVFEGQAGKKVEEVGGPGEVKPSFGEVPRDEWAK